VNDLLVISAVAVGNRSQRSAKGPGTYLGPESTRIVPLQEVYAVSFDNPAKEKVLNLLRNYEGLWAENLAMREMFRTYRGVGIPGWEEILESLLSNAECQIEIRAKFTPIYAAFEE